MVVHQDSLWNWGMQQLGNGLFLEGELDKGDVPKFPVYNNLNWNNAFVNLVLLKQSLYGCFVVLAFSFLPDFVYFLLACVTLRNIFCNLPPLQRGGINRTLKTRFVSVPRHNSLVRFLKLPASRSNEDSFMTFSELFMAILRSSLLSTPLPTPTAITWTPFACNQYLKRWLSWWQRGSSRHLLSFLDHSYYVRS